MAPYLENGISLTETHTIKFEGDSGSIELHPDGPDSIKVFPQGDITAWLANKGKKECIVFPDESGVHMDSFTIYRHSLLVRNNKTGEEKVVIYSDNQ